jgi:hypothetical protein
MASFRALVLVIALLADAGLPDQEPSSSPEQSIVASPEQRERSADSAPPAQTPAPPTTAPITPTAAPASAVATSASAESQASDRTGTTNGSAFAAPPPTASATPSEPLAVGSKDADDHQSSFKGSWFAWAGWMLSLLLALYLIRAQGKWRAAFENKEWLLLPSHSAHQLEEGLQRLAHHAAALTSRVQESATKSSKHVESVSQAIHDTRSEFAILREELDQKTKEIANLKLGHDFHSRRPVLRAVAHALQIIEEDQACGRNSEVTLDGVAVELRECLQDNNVVVKKYEPGMKLSDAKGVSTQESIKEPASEDSLKGTIGETIRSAYVVVGPAGDEEVLRHARVRIFT